MALQGAEYTVLVYVLTSCLSTTIFVFWNRLLAIYSEDVALGVVIGRKYTP